MDAQKIKNPRSIAIAPKSSSLTLASAKPQQGTQIKSNPAVGRQHTAGSHLTHSQDQGPSQRREDSGSRILDVRNCDSQASPRDDPFIRSHPSSHLNRSAAESRIAQGLVKRNDDPSKNANLPQVNIVVLGNSRVGKSTFIQRALDLRENAPTASPSKKMSLDGIIYVVRLFELQVDDITIDETRRVVWPRLIDIPKQPSLDGALILYDITDEESVNEIPDILYALGKSEISSLVISCKEDNPPQLRQVDGDFNNQIKSRYPKVEICSTSANVPESQKRCISLILRSILKSRTGSDLINPPSSGRSRASTSSGKDLPREDRELLDKSKTHYRATSDLSISDSTGRPKAPLNRLEARKPSRKLAVGIPPLQEKPSSSHSSDPHTPISASGPVSDDSSSSSEKQSADISSSPDSPPVTSILRPETADSQAHNTFLIMEEESQDESQHGSPSPPLLAETPEASQSAPDAAGSSFDELVDRLLSLPMSKQDGKFVPVFLCLYRKFANPLKVFSAITNRFARVELSNAPRLIKVGEQLRYLQVLALWSDDYPGDFAPPTIKRDIIAFVKKLEKSQVFAYAAKEISNHLELAIVDEDADWNRLDGADALHEAGDSTNTQSAPVTSSILTGEPTMDDLLKSSNRSSSEASDGGLTRTSVAPSTASSVFKSANMSSQSSSAHLSRDEGRQEAQTIVASPRTRLSKIQWHQFVETPDDDIANELTRMDWVLYSSMRPRDLVRHVILANDANKRDQSLESVHRMIDHFNHVFCFVSATILLRDKPKHRARMLEKWMTVAWKVRQLNNYNTLGSIIAGTNGTAVHRLTATWELVPEQIRKNYMRLTILMGTVRSHGAYRMAWENSFSERIPFLPVYRKDLVAAETGNPTFFGPLGERINWKKYEVMGEVIISMQKSQDKAYKLPRNEEVMRLVLETKIGPGDEDLAEELYERSLQVEPTGTGDTSRKKFDWLRR